MWMSAETRALNWPRIHLPPVPVAVKVHGTTRHACPPGLQGAALVERLAVLPITGGATPPTKGSGSLGLAFPPS